MNLPEVSCILTLYNYRGKALFHKGKETRVEAWWLQNKKKICFRHIVSDKCLILAVNSILRSGARKSASVL